MSESGLGSQDRRQSIHTNCYALFRRFRIAGSGRMNHSPIRSESDTSPDFRKGTR
jgi:hypothetical protein